MAYTPTEWQSGDIVTSAKLNKIEQGIANASAGGGGTMIVNITSDEVEGQTVYSADKNFAEIAAAVEAGEDVVARISFGDNDFSQLSMYTYINTSESKSITWEHVNMRKEPAPPLLMFEGLYVELLSDGATDTVEFTNPTASIPLS